MSSVLDVLRAGLSWGLGRISAADSTVLVCGGRQFGGNSRPIFEAARRQGLNAVWLTTRSEILALGVPGVVDARSIEGLRLAARAGGVVFTHSLGDFYPAQFAPGTALFNVWHGMPIKKISTADPRFMSRSYAKANLREMARFTGMFATSAEMVNIFAQTFRQPPERVHLTGQPRTDPLAGPPPPLRQDLDLPAHSRRILHCPTWRDGEPARLFPFDDFDAEGLQSTLERLDAVLFVRLHPNDPSRPRRDRRIVPFQGDQAPEITDYLGHFDALITDYSSVYYDYLLLDRPTIFLPYDIERYQSAPGFYIPFEQIAKGPWPRSFAQFVEALESSLLRPDDGAADRAAVRARIHAHEAGGATERVLAIIRARLAQPAGDDGGEAS